MTLDEYTQLLEAPTSVDASHISALRDLLRYAPYCASARLLLLKALYDAGDPSYANEMQRTLLAVPPQTSLYFLLNPKKIRRSADASKKPAKRSHSEAVQSYFDMIARMQEVAQHSGLSLSEITQRYISTREYTRE